MNHKRAMRQLLKKLRVGKNGKNEIIKQVTRPI